MLNVLLIYYEPIPAGQTTHVLALAQGLRARGHRVSLVLPADLQRSIKAFEQANIDVVPLALRKVVWRPRAVVALIRLIQRGNFDVVHIHSQEAGLLGRVVAWMAGAQLVIYTPQVIDIRRARWHWLYVLIERILSQITAMIISVNEFDQRRMIGWGIPSRKIVTIPNGIDLSAFERQSDAGSLRRAMGLDENCPLVIQVGRLSAQKNPLAFVEGAAQVIQKRPDTRFMLVGEGPMRKAITLRAKALGLDGAISLLGWQDNAADLIAAADVVSLTSRWEGMPHVLLEAMACSRPVVATAVNGCPEIVVDGVTGFLSPPGDVESWAERVVDLLNNPVKKNEMGQRGRDRVGKKFSRRDMVTQIDKLYRQLTEST